MKKGKQIKKEGKEECLKLKLQSRRRAKKKTECGWSVSEETREREEKGGQTLNYAGHY